MIDNKHLGFLSLCFQGSGRPNVCQRFDVIMESIL